MSTHTTITLPTIHAQMVAEVLDVHTRHCLAHAEQLHALARSAEGDEQQEIIQHWQAVTLITDTLIQIRDEIRRAI